MKIVAIVEARMGATRLPGKTLMKIEGKPLLEILLERIKSSDLLDEIIVATTTNKEDDVIVDFCKKQDYKFFIGSEEDVLDRVLNAAKMFKGDIIIELTADCPLVDAELVDKMVKFYFKGEYDFISTINTDTSPPGRTFPVGYDLRIFSTKILEEIDRLTKDPYDRENVSSYIFNHPEKYKLGIFKAENKLRDPTIRLTIDYKEDFLLMKKIIEHFKDHLVSLEKLIKFIKENPELKKLNEKYDVKSYRK